MFDTRTEMGVERKLQPEMSREGIQLLQTFFAWKTKLSPEKLLLRSFDATIKIINPHRMTLETLHPMTHTREKG